MTWPGGEFSAIAYHFVCWLFTPSCARINLAAMMCQHKPGLPPNFINLNSVQMLNTNVTQDHCYSVNTTQGISCPAIPYYAITHNTIHYLAIPLRTLGNIAIQLRTPHTMYTRGKNEKLYQKDDHDQKVLVVQTPLRKYSFWNTNFRFLAEQLKVHGNKINTITEKYYCPDSKTWYWGKPDISFGN